MDRRQVTVRNDKMEAFKKFAVVVGLMAMSAFVLYFGIQDTSLFSLLLGGAGVLVCLVLLVYYGKYLVADRVYFILDESGIRSADDSFQVKWEEAERFYYDRGRTFVHLVAKTKNGAIISATTGNVISVKSLTALLQGYGATVIR